MIFLCSAHAVLSQAQLVLLKNEHVVLRLYPGDDFVYKLKGSTQIKSTYVNNLSDTAVVTHSDVVPFHRIDRLYFKRETFLNRLGVKLVGAGVVLFLFDQLNVVLVQGDKARLNEGVVKVSSVFVVVGLPMALIRKKSQRMHHPYRLFTVKEGSPFYQPDPRGFTLPSLGQ